MKVEKPEFFFENKNLFKDHFPYLYFPEYNSFLKNTEKKTSVIIRDDKMNSIICKCWKNKFLSLLQPMYPPLSNEGARLNVGEEKDFLNKLIVFVKQNKLADRITQPENCAIFQSAPDATISTPFGTYYLELANHTEEELFKNLHVKHRNVIRNAEKHAIILKYGAEVINDFYTLYKDTMQRSNMYCQSLSYFKNFYESMSENIFCGVAYHNQTPQGALFMPFSKFGAFYLYGASASKIEINGSMNYLHWNTIKLAKQKGINRYDFVGARLSDVSGTKLEGIQQFKERFGATLEKGVLWKKDIDKLTCTLFDNLVTFKLYLKKQKPPLDIIDQENKKKRV